MMKKATLITVCCSWILINAATANSFIIDPEFTPWQQTASGSRSGRGVAGTLTWSIVPDGTTVNDGESNLGGSDLIEFLNENFDGDPNESDHTQQPWFTLLESSFERWDELSGLSFEYEANDDGGNHRTRPGRLGTRGDIRISGASVDGDGGILAFNFFPEFGGDMAIDTDDDGLALDRNNFRFFRNTVMHEIGHAFSLSHVTSDTDRLLMEPFTDTVIDGPQLDEIRGIQYYFGDIYESSNDELGNGSVSLATDLGTLSLANSIVLGQDADRRSSQRITSTYTDFVSISHPDDIDYYSFEVSGTGLATVELKPLGGTFSQAGEFGQPTTFDAGARYDLAFSILDADGTTVIADVDDVGVGGIESIESITLSPGVYYAEIYADAEDTVQLYRLDIELSPLGSDCNADGTIDGFDLDCACGVGLDPVLEELDALQGDLNLDGEVGFDDFLILSASFGAEGNYTDGDLDCDGEVAFADFLIFSTSFGEGVGTNATEAVPEPELGLWLLLAIGFLTRRKKS